MIDWLAFSRQIAADLDAVLAEHPTRFEREQVVGAGEGGDETTAIDAAAERAVVLRLEELAAAGNEFMLVSEELGERSFGADTPRLVLDPIDGSMNAKRGVPFFSVSLAVAEGPTMADVFFGYVFDFGTREEWTARRGEGAFLNGAPLSGPVLVAWRNAISSASGRFNPSRLLAIRPVQPVWWFAPTPG